MSDEPRLFSNIKPTFQPSQATSDPLTPVSGLCLLGAYFPSGYTGGDLTFQVSVDGVTWVPAYYAPGDGSAAVAVKIAAQVGGSVGVDPVKTLALQRVKVVCASAPGATVPTIVFGAIQ